MVTGINRNKPYVNFALAAVNVLVFLYLEAVSYTHLGNPGAVLLSERRVFIGKRTYP